ncbi:CinA family protein [Chryseolinea sp. T2]|uniref:CinA family protein n=1 Tax=Chryseolinea sp. T2 TaxID=3129255 RepID=UPI0030768DCC
MKSSKNEMAAQLKTLELISLHLIDRNETIAVAESVTAGLLTRSFSLAENATYFLQGGIIVYNLGQKARHLKVNPIHGERTNCVSAEIAIQMALAVADQFCSEWGLAITGYAAPVPELKIESCFAHYAITNAGRVVHSNILETKLLGQARVQQYFVDQLLKVFKDQLS